MRARCVFNGDTRKFSTMTSTDDVSINAIVSEFFAAFRSPEAGKIQRTELRRMFLPQALIVNVSDDGSTVMNVESFIEPREALLNSGRLQKFSEKEVSAVTQVFGGIATRWSLYTKTGFLDGEPYDGWGRKAIHFVRMADRWRISAIAWQDGAKGSPVPPG